MNILLDIYLEKNLGDDLFLESVLNRYPEHQFYIFSQLDYSNFEKNHPNFKVIRLNKIVNYLNAKLKKKSSVVKKFVKKYNIDALVCIGGSIFIEFDGWESLYQERLNLWQYMKQLDKSIYVISSNFGPFHSEVFLKNYSNLFNSVDDICFRDEYSFDLFKEKSNVRKEADVVLSLPLKGKKVNIEGNSIGISVINLLNRNPLKKHHKEYINKMAEIIDQYNNENKTVYLLSFCEREGDEQAIQEVLSNVVHKDNVQVVNYRGDIPAFMNIFSKLDSIIATRFHSIILGMIYNQNIYALNYSDKSVNFINNHNLNIEMSSIENVKDLNIETINRSMTKTNSLNDLIVSGEKQYEALDKLLLK